jgi:hypothetical protein
VLLRPTVLALLRHRKPSPPVRALPPPTADRRHADTGGVTAAVLETVDAAAGRVPDPAAVDVAALVVGLVPGR